MRIAAAIAGIAAITIAVLAYVSGDNDGADDPRGLISRLTLSNGRTSFKVGEPIHMRLEITNYTGKPLEVDYGSAQKYDFVVLEQLAVDAAAEIWHWSWDNEYPDPRTNQEWQRKQIVAFEGTWPQLDRDGQPVLPGDYIADGRHYACRTAADYHCDSMALVRFTIEP